MASDQSDVDSNLDKSKTCGEASSEERIEPRRYIIDIHTHFIPKTLPDFNTRYGYSGFVWLDTRGSDESGFGKLMKGSTELTFVPECAWSLTSRLQHMDEHGIRIQVLSPVPSLFSYWAKADDTADLCRIVNNSISKEISRFKTDPNSVSRFLGLAIVPMQAPELAVIELERCVKELGFVGVLIGTHVNDWNLDSPELVPFWEVCEDLQCPVFVHPWDMEISRKDRKFKLPELIGMPHETNRAITTMLLGGVLEKFPNLKICFSDGAGSFPYIHGRVSQGYDLSPKDCAQLCDVPPNKFLGKFFADSVVGSSNSLDLLLDVIGQDRVVYGTNYPFAPGSFPVTHDQKQTSRFGVQALEMMNQARNVDNEVAEKILALNALEFLGIEPSRVFTETEVQEDETETSTEEVEVEAETVEVEVEDQEQDA